MYTKHLSIPLFTLMVLAGCGGGGGDNSATNNGVSAQITKIEASVDYRPSGTNTTSYDAYARVNVANSIAPNIIGMPSGARPNFSATGLPAGFSIDSSTGVISGTPTAVSVGQVSVTMTVAGFTGSVGTQFSLYVKEVPPPALVWTQQSVHAGFAALSQHNAATIGATIYVVGSRLDNRSIETWRSSDKGVTWQKLAAAPGVAVSDFALSGDGTALYLAGGVNAAKVASNEMWRFDGTSWSKVAVQTPFTSRWGHTLTKFANKWVVVGGSTYDASSNMAVTNLGDVWESRDNGVNWLKMVAKTTINSGLIRTGHCATVLNGKMYLVNGVALGSDWSNSSDSRPRISVSTDGVTWTNILAGSASGQHAYGACVTYNGKIIVVGGNAIDASGVSMIGRANTFVSTFSNLDDLLNPGSFETTRSPMEGSKGLPSGVAYRYANGMVVIGSEFLIMGGRNGSRGDRAVMDDVWSSSL